MRLSNVVALGVVGTLAVLAGQGCNSAPPKEHTQDNKADLYGGTGGVVGFNPCLLQVAPPPGFSPATRSSDCPKRVLGFQLTVPSGQSCAWDVVTGSDGVTYYLPPDSSSPSAPVSGTDSGSAFSSPAYSSTYYACYPPVVCSYHLSNAWYYSGGWHTIGSGSSAQLWSVGTSSLQSQATSSTFAYQASYILEDPTSVMVYPGGVISTEIPQFVTFHGEIIESITLPSGGYCKPPPIGSGSGSGGTQTGGGSNCDTCTYPVSW